MMPPNKVRRGKLKKIILFIMVATAAVLAFGGIVMWLWNTIIPSLIQGSVISYWQAVGLLLLCRILFGNWRAGFGGGHHAMKDGGVGIHFKERIMNMSKEEKTAMKEAWEKRCEKKRS
jgi:ABC-type multidrug transport system fused ATPase/permease subunit